MKLNIPIQYQYILLLENDIQRVMCSRSENIKCFLIEIIVLFLLLFHPFLQSICYKVSPSNIYWSFLEIRKSTCSALQCCLFFIASKFEQMLFYNNKQDTNTVHSWSANTKQCLNHLRTKIKGNLKMILSHAVNYFQILIKDKHASCM